MQPLMDRQQLIFDADDTLWENNVYFEQAFEKFIVFLNHEHLSTQEIRDVLDRFERANIESQHYGSRAFAASLVETWCEITGSHDDQQLHTVEQFGLRILDIEMELIAGVEETLEALRPHHDLLLLTKGDLDEQRLKIERSSVSRLFDAHIITQEKNTGIYREVVDSLDLDIDRSWMIGNSTRSDIHPALDAGLHAVLIPHAMTWHLEHIEFEHHPDWAERFRELKHFSDLRSIFKTIRSH